MMSCAVKLFWHNKNMHQQKLYYAKTFHLMLNTVSKLLYNHQTMQLMEGLSSLSHHNQTISSTHSPRIKTILF